jgi:hypothetical protein
MFDLFFLLIKTWKKNPPQQSIIVLVHKHAKKNKYGQDII